MKNSPRHLKRKHPINQGMILLLRPSILYPMMPPKIIPITIDQLVIVSDRSFAPLNPSFDLIKNWLVHAFTKTSPSRYPDSLVKQPAREMPQIGSTFTKCQSNLSYKLSCLQNDRAFFFAAALAKGEVYGFESSGSISVISDSGACIYITRVGLSGSVSVTPTSQIPIIAIAASTYIKAQKTGI